MQSNDYVIQKRSGGKFIERLSPESLAACATGTKRTVQQLLDDNGYSR